MKKILISVSIIGAVAAIVFGVTTAFFSDTETSTGNTFTAGAIDLKIDNHSWYNGVERTDLGWDLDDLTGHLFFNYEDLKPGDWGEDTVSIHVDDNDAWACVDIFIKKNDDMSSAEPELEAGDDLEVASDIWDGELAEELNFIFWVDDGDNVLETGEEVLVSGRASDILLAGGVNGINFALADKNENNVGGSDGTPLKGGDTYYIGKAWCYGTLTLTYDGQGDPSNVPGFTCNGAPVGNLSQTDNMMVDIGFYAEQSRHNPDFECSPKIPETSMPTQLLENKDTGWNVIEDDTYGNIVYSDGAKTFYGTVVGQGLVPNGKYQITLNGPGICTTTDNNLAGNGASTNLFEQGYWDGVGPNLSNTCQWAGQGVYNMALIDDWYTVIADGSGNINYSFNLALPSGTYTGVKVLVKKMLDTHESPWVDTTTEYTTNLYETAAINFTVAP